MDLNGDGYKDVISGSWPGEIFLFEGKSDGSFAGRRMLKDKDGEYINIGGGVKEEAMMFFSQGKDQPKGLLITGFAEFKSTPDGTVVEYHGKEYKSTKDRPIATTGSASTVHVGDLDGDGDYDLVVGTIRGDVYMIPNEGTATAYSFGKEKQLEADGKPINVGGRAGPFVADWDGDGDLDLIVGCEDGGVKLYENKGSAKSMKLATAVQLVEPGKASSTREPPKEAVRGTRAKVCVADFNDDGLPDLLVGDYGYMKPDLPEPTDEEKAQQEQDRKKLDEVTQQWRDVSQKLYDSTKKLTQEEIDSCESQRKELYAQMSELRSKLPAEYETHGWVWLFLRKSK